MMLIENVEYEGLVYGVSEQGYRKIGKLLKNTFGEVEYEYGEEAGTVILRGPAPMFDENDENMPAVFDLLASIVQPGGQGVILEKKWSVDGSLALGGYVFSEGAWERGSVDFDGKD